MAHRLASEAQDDLDAIWYYLATESRNVAIADRVIDRITEAFYLLATHPHIGRRRDEDLRPGLRSFPVSHYTILYRVAGEDVLILYIKDDRRDLPALLNE